ncbi:tryptophan--tRNA ligase [Sulfolobales archaeon HS-7]|nr:tryptophan--tRNA ligase [Sulfolobales archaeon HS-7]
MSEGFAVTPWNVKGKVDYDKLIEQFGTKKIDEQLLIKMRNSAGELHVLLRRGIFFSHRDLDLVLQDFEQGKGFFLYTGRGPSRDMHVGHIIPFIFTKWLQEKFNANVYIEVTDDEKYLAKQDLELEEVKQAAKENILDIIAVGFDKDKTFIFQDTQYIKQMYPLALKIAKKLNFSEVKATFGFENSTNIGMLFYPALQIAPTFFEKKRCLIPAGIDQDPYWRLQRDLAPSLGYLKAAAIHSKFFPPLTGIEGKMSSSQPETAIYLTDDEKTVRNKIMKYAFSGGQPTIELQRKLGGNPDIDISFIWLYYYFEDNDKRIEEIREEYTSGKMLTGELKEILIEKLNTFLEVHRQEREKRKDMIKEFMYEGKLASQMWENNIF